MAEPDAPQVLLVEDNPDHEELIRRAFAEREPRVTLQVARHGEEALDYLHRRGEFEDPSRSPRPRLILLDLRLPRVDGLEVLGEIKSTPALRSTPGVSATKGGACRKLSRWVRDSMRITSAPKSARYLVSKGPTPAQVKSITRSPANAWPAIARWPPRPSAPLTPPG